MDRTGLQQSMRLEKGLSWIWWSLQENNNGPCRAEENLEGFRVKPAAIHCSLGGPGCLTGPYHIPLDPHVPQLGGSASSRANPLSAGTHGVPQGAIQLRPGCCSLLGPG